MGWPTCPVAGALTVAGYLQRPVPPAAANINQAARIGVQMPKPVILAFVSLVPLFFNCGSTAHGQKMPVKNQVRAHSLGPAGVLKFDMPEDWAFRGKRLATDGLTFRITPAGNATLVLRVTTFAPPPGPRSNAWQRPALRKILDTTLVPIRRVAVESTFTYRDIAGPGARGLYVWATDRTVTGFAPGKFKYVAQGVVAVGSVLAAFTLLTHLDDGPERELALEVVRSLRVVPR